MPHNSAALPLLLFFLVPFHFVVNRVYGAPADQHGYYRPLNSLQFCPEGTDKSLRENKCFLFVDTQKSFIDAQSHCQSQNGNLVAIRNGLDNHLLADHARDRFHGQLFYLGASVINSNAGTWRWPDESQLKFTHWFTPITAMETQFNQCVAMNPLNRGKWMAVDCFRKMPFVCEIPIAEPWNG